MPHLKKLITHLRAPFPEPDMNSLLQKDIRDIQSILGGTVDVAMEYFKHQQSLQPSMNIGDLPPAILPIKGLGAQETLRLFAENYATQMANSAGPRYFGFVTGGSTPAAVAGDWLVSVYDQVMSGSNDSVAHALERQTIQFLLELFGLNGDFSGTFVTGATMSNFVSLATARQWIGEQYGVNFSEDGLGQVPIRVLSATPHSSILKSLSMLGIGRKAWLKIDTMDDREAINLEKLEEQLRIIDGPCIVVANAGTVNTVDFDDLSAIARLKERYKFWLHVDAAFGGFASVSPKFRHLVNGLEMADTVTVDAHKWLNVPYDAAMQFTKHRDLQVKVFQNNAAYLGDPALMPDSMHLTPENSRRFRALPSWFTLMAYGKDGYRDIVERNCSAAKALGDAIHASDDFRLLAPVRMNVVCFSLKKNSLTMDEIRWFLQEIRDDGAVFFTPTLYKGIPAIRAAISNWQTSISDVELGFDVLKKIYKKSFSEVV
jgi:glutamate/tyrosine decarboxylase-like PLP-dependent enzyme